jgi:hypothetical protein
MLSRFTSALISAAVWMLASLPAGATSTATETTADELEKPKQVPAEAAASMNPVVAQQPVAVPAAPATVTEVPTPAAEAADEEPTAAPAEAINTQELADTNDVKRSRRFEHMRNYLADNYEEIMTKIEHRYARRMESLESMRKGLEDDFSSADRRYEELRKQALKEMDNAIRRYDELRKMAVEEQEARIRRYEEMKRAAMEEREARQKQYEELRKSIEEQRAQMEKDREAMQGMSTDERRAYIENHMNEMIEKRAQMMEQRTVLSQTEPPARIPRRAE